MTISFSGLVSGLDTSSWVAALVSVKQQKVTALESQLATLQTKQSTLTTTQNLFTTLQTAIEKLTDLKFGGSFDLFSNNTASSSNENIFTVTATSDAARQSYDVTVQQLATYTKASAAEAVSAVADDTTVLSNLGITSGTFTVYVDGVKSTINIEDGDTLGDLKADLAAVGVKAEIDENGILQLSAYDSESTLAAGATTDTSNFVSLVGLEKQEDGTYLAGSALFKATTSSLLTSEESGFNTQITAGTFTIGDAVFTITDDTTLASLISEINSSDEAQAYAYWDDSTGKLVITSKVEGASYINIEAGTSNFTDVMGFTSTEYDEYGNVSSSRMYTEAQTLGNNAIFTINGTTMTSASNTITSDISRLTGVTIKLTGVTSEDDGTSTLTVKQDPSALVDAVNDFITAYNDVLDQITMVTASDGDLARDSSLKSFKTTVMNLVNGANTTNGGVYTLLSEIGISVSSADSGNLSTNTYTLTLDEDKFLAALEENPDSVKSILCGENSVLSSIETTVENMLTSVTGYFALQSSTVKSDISTVESKISKWQTKISNYQTKLEHKFYKMEMAIASMQQNYSVFLS